MSFVYAMILFIFAVVAFFYASRVIYGHNYKKKTFVLFSFTAFASGLWSTGYAGMLVVSVEKDFWIMRAIGISGLFAFLISAQFLLACIAEYKKTAYALIIFEAVLGVVVFILAVYPDSTRLVYSENGLVTVFNNPAISIIYTLYTVFVAVCFIIESVRMLSHKYMKNVRAFGRNLLIVEALILIGMVIDTILPAMGKNLNIPASTMMQFIGLDILYHAIHRVDRNIIGLQNLAGYANSSLKTPIMVFDMKNRMTIINQEARKVFGLSYKDINRTDFLKDAFDLDNPYDELKELITKEFDVTYAKEEKYFHLYIDPIINEFDDYVGYIVMASDVTKVQLYTRELENAKNEATRANRAKSQFLANMSHEIRTPMNSILGFSELCLNDDITEASKGYVSDIRDSAEILLAIINDILDISKIESGKMDLVVSEYSPQEVFIELSRIIELQAAKKDLYFKYNIAEHFPKRLKGDKTKIRAILINILNNGIKYTKEGGITLNVGYENCENNICRVRLIIEDTGIGIRKEDIDTIFEVFQRVDLSSNSSTEGTGLGLAISKGFADLMNGKIEVESEYGLGTKFTITIDQENVEVEKEKTEETKSLETTDKILRLKDANILAVDDIALNLKLIKAILAKCGASVTVAQSGEEAIKLCSENSYDLVFMDQMMPVMDGVTAMLEIRKLGNGYEVGGNIKIIALTANVIDGAREERIKEGFDDFLGKPINKEQLDIALINYLSPSKYYYE